MVCECLQTSSRNTVQFKYYSLIKDKFLSSHKNIFFTFHDRFSNISVDVSILSFKLGIEGYNLGSFVVLAI